MSSTWCCPVCGEDVLGSVCPRADDADHLRDRIEALEEEGERLARALRAAEGEE